MERAVNDTHTTCWDYVEVRDGDSPFADLIGRFCGDSAPAAITSSAGYLWVKFFSDENAGMGGFTATLDSVEPPCGSRQVLMTLN